VNRGTVTENLQLTIDGIDCSIPPTWTILQAAESLGIVIPTICFHTACTANSLCRICVVEVEGSRVLIPACSTVITAGMIIHTNTERVQNSRRMILELMLSSTDLSQAPEIIDLANEYQADRSRFPGAVSRVIPVMDDNPMYVRDYSRCILCWRCVQVCSDDAQYTYAINFKGRGFHTSISTFFEKPLLESTCVFCGQCVGVCPTGALKPKKEWLLEQGLDKQSIMQMTVVDRKKRMRHVQTTQEEIKNDK
jgi:NADH dehydrogenase/NADH:ubiquinone oxidoreductase subunit G